MSDYCYIPPFVTDPNTPPNIMFIYEKGAAITKRAYSTTYTYDSANPYYGFFDSRDSSNNPVYYSFAVDGNKAFSPNYFEKSSTCSAEAAPARYKCIPGDILDWALMTTIDLSRKVLVGFGWPKAVASEGAGDVYTYSGQFNDSSGDQTPGITPISYGQYEDGNADTTVAVTVDMDGDGDTLDATDYTYRFCMSKGNPEATVTVNGQLGTTAPSCPNPNTPAKCKLSGTCLGAGTVAVKLTSEDRKGLIQQYADKDSNYVYDSDAPRFGLRRWKGSTAADERDRDILCDCAAAGDPAGCTASGNCTSTSKTTLLKEYLNAFSKTPGIDPDDAELGTMMKDVINYFKGNSSTYEDKDAAYTQTGYKWLTDPAYKCRKTYAIFVTTGAYLTGGADYTASLAEVSTACDSLTYSDEFVKAACYGFNKDLYDDPDDPEKKQNIRTYVVHTDFYGPACPPACAAGTCSGGYCRGDVARLTYAAKTVGGGEYISVNNPAALKSKIEEAFLNIISTSASASTVATLTTQTRESSTLTQAYFYPKREGTILKWIGYLRLLWSDGGANLREDTANKGWLDLKKDNILSFYYDSTAVAYKAKTYTDDGSVAGSTAGDLKIDSCSTFTTWNNDVVKPIWNAQDKLLARTADDRTIKIKTGNTSGVVAGGALSDFTTALDSTLYPYWNYTSYCSNYTSRWCAANSDCNYCATLRGTHGVDRGCSSASDCQFCDGRRTRKCTTDLTCIRKDNGETVTPTVACATVGDDRTDGTNNCECVGDCYEYYGTCNTASLVCDVDGTTDCAAQGLGNACTVSGSTGTCKAQCTLDATQLCTTDAGCINDYHGSVAGSGCDTADTCTTAAAGTCVNDCDANCAKSVIKFLRGYDKPSHTPPGATAPGNAYRERTQCTANADCPGGTCSMTSAAGTCSTTTSTLCDADSDCPTGEKCYGTCSSTSYDILTTLKLGDIVYSTPRISPNSAINGYDVTYGDDSYKNWVDSKIKGTCTTSADCPGLSDKTWFENQACTDGVCSQDGYMPIVILGANDGMVHAFKVSKIKDISPQEDDCYADASCDTPFAIGVNEGAQVARFADLPHSVKTSDSGTGADTAPPSDLGKELWAYIPFNAVPYLRWYCDSSYCHIPMVDARFNVFDASIDYDKDGTVEASEGRTATDVRCTVDATSPCPDYPWRRLLVGAMGAGGKKITVGSNTWSSSIFVLDITDSINPVLLWEKPMPDNTLTTSNPATVVRLASAATDASKNENGKWYLVMGSGAESITTNKMNFKTPANAYIYVFDLRTGNLEASLDIGASGVAVGDMMAVDYDSDYQVDDIYFGTYGGTTGAYKGKFYRLRLRNDASYQTTPADWDIETVVVPGTTADGRPIFASPEVALDADQNIWLYFGTGVYLTLEHAAATPSVNEYLYAVKETEGCWKGTTSPRSDCTYSDFLDTSGMNFTGAKAIELGCFCAGSLISTISCESAGSCSGTCGASEDTVVLKVQEATLTKTAGGDEIPTEPTNCTSAENKTDTSAIACLTADINASYNGWRRAIAGQKSFSKPFVAGGLVDFTSFEPTSTSCSLGGNTHLYALHYTSGTAYVQPTIFLAGGATKVGGSLSNITINASVNLGTGVPPLGESLVALPLAGDTYKVITQVSGGLPGTSMSPSLPAKGGYVLWIVK
ncbi:MAG: hypothetical protein HZA11_01695 [Nitrospirae bacterium]|nr:hypothetical protein [Nitrospirota bacterium]